MAGFEDPLEFGVHRGIQVCFAEASVETKAGPEEEGSGREAQRVNVPGRKVSSGEGLRTIGGAPGGDASGLIQRARHLGHRRLLGIFHIPCANEAKKYIPSMWLTAVVGGGGALLYV